MKLRNSSIISIVFAGLLLSSCVTYYPIKQASGSSLNLQLSEDQYKILGVGRGSACSSRWFGFLGSNDEFAFEVATDRAISTRKGGNHLIQTTTDARTYTVLFFYAEVCVIVRGLVVKLDQLKEIQVPLLPEDEIDDVKKSMYRITYENLLSDIEKNQSRQFIAKFIIADEIEATGIDVEAHEPFRVFQAHVEGRKDEKFYLAIKDELSGQIENAKDVGYGIELLYQPRSTRNGRPVVWVQWVVE